jgi:hypothetical protein
MFAMATVHATHTELQDAPIVGSVRLVPHPPLGRDSHPEVGYSIASRALKTKVKGGFATGTLPAESAR